MNNISSRDRELHKKMVCGDTLEDNDVNFVIYCNAMFLTLDA